jgi:hypothetical protein
MVVAVVVVVVVVALWSMVQFVDVAFVLFYFIVMDSHDKNKQGNRWAERTE